MSRLSCGIDLASRRTALPVVDTLGPVRFRTVGGRVLLTNDTGDHALVSQEEFQGLVSDLMSQLGGISMKGAAAVAATDATTPALRKLESTAIANSTPISYNPRELLILMHEHLLASGLPGVLASSSVDRFLANSLPSWTQNGLASPT